MRAVNLLPGDAYAEKHFYTGWVGDGDSGQTKKIVMGAGAVAALVAVLLGFMFFHERSVIQNRRTTLADVNQRVAAAEASVAAARASQALAQSRLAAASGLTSQRVVWERVLRDLSRVLPGNVWLQTLQVQAPVAAVPAAAGVIPTDTTASVTTDGTAPAPAPAPVAAPAPTFTVTGFTGSQRDVALVLDRLALLPWLSNVSLTSSARGGGTSSDTAASSASPVQFTIGATLSSTGGK